MVWREAIGLLSLPVQQCLVTIHGVGLIGIACLVFLVSCQLSSLKLWYCRGAEVMAVSWCITSVRAVLSDVQSRGPDWWWVQRILQCSGPCSPDQVLLCWYLNWSKELALIVVLSKAVVGGISSCCWRNVIFLEAFWQQRFFSLYDLANVPCSFLLFFFQTRMQNLEFMTQNLTSGLLA